MEICRDIRRKKRAQKLWAFLRDTVLCHPRDTKAVKEALTTISHGVHHVHKICLDENIISVCWNKLNKTIITVEESCIKTFSLQENKLKETYPNTEKVIQIVVNTKHYNYIGLIDSKTIKIFNKEFQVVATTYSKNEISCFCYNEYCSNVITGGKGNLSIFQFRYAGMYLILGHAIKNDDIQLDDFHKIVLQPSTVKHQKCFAVSGSSIAVFDVKQYCLLEVRRNSHIKKITSILYFAPTNNIVTGSRDGSIKVWTEDFEIKLVFVGHVKPVVSLNVYPQGPYIMSSSYDKTIRVWSLESSDEVDLIEGDEKLLGLYASPDSNKLFTYSSKFVDIWKVTHLHQIFTSIGYSVKKMEMYQYRNLVDRVLCCGNDGSVRLVSPLDGTILTTMLPPCDKESDCYDNEIVDAVYCLPLESIYAVYGDGGLHRASTLSSPADAEFLFKFDGDEKLTCLELYENIADKNEINDTWNQIRLGVKNEDIKRKFEYGYSILLIGGTESGNVVVLDLNTGSVQYSVQAHSSKIVKIVSNVGSKEIITSGADKLVKVWKVYPNTRADPFTLFTTFFCAQVATRVVVTSHDILIVGFQQNESATFTTVHYNLKNQARSDHEPDFDHTNELTGISCLKKLSLVATCSMDGSIHIWNERNCLIRKLKLNGAPHSICFCNERGDILVGLEGNIHLIKGSSYLPRVYTLKVTCIDVRRQFKECEFERNRVLYESLPDKHKDKLTFAKSSYKNYSFESGSMEKPSDQEYKEEEMSKIRKRDQEIVDLRDGLITSKRSQRKARTKVRSRVFKKYMDLWHHRPVHKVESQESVANLFESNPNPPKEKPQSPKRRYKGSDKPHGFFPSVKSAKPLQDMLEENIWIENRLESGPDVEKKGYLVHPRSYIPNSILVRLLWPQQCFKAQKEQLAKNVDSVNTISESVRRGKQLLSTVDNSMNPSAGLERTGSATSSHASQNSSQTGSLKNKLMEAISNVKNSPQSSAVKLVEEEQQDQPAAPPLPKVRSSQLKHQVKELPPRPVPRKSINKIVEKTEEPEFLKMFEDQSWYLHHERDIEKNMQPPYTAMKFFEAITSQLAASKDWEERTQICQALHSLWYKQHLEDCPQILESTLIKMISLAQSNVAEEREFLEAAFELYRAVVDGKKTKKLVIELLTSYLQGNEFHKSFVIETLNKIGLEDEHSYLSKDLDSWELWKIREGSKITVKDQLRNLVLRWIGTWTDKFKAHYNKAVNDLKKGKKVEGKLRVKNPLGGAKELNKLKRFDLLAVRRDKIDDEINLIEILNYFCEIADENEKMREKVAELSILRSDKTTIVALPYYTPQNIAIRRLGETHVSRRPRRSSKLAVEYRLNIGKNYPDLNAPFTNKLVLNPSHVTMCPLECEEIDRFDQLSNLYQPVLITLRNPIHQKYFVPEKSYVH